MTPTTMPLYYCACADLEGGRGSWGLDPNPCKIQISLNSHYKTTKQKISLRHPWQAQIIPPPPQKKNSGSAHAMPCKT